MKMNRSPAKPNCSNRGPATRNSPVTTMVGPIANYTCGSDPKQSRTSTGSVEAGARVGRAPFL